MRTYRWARWAMGVLMSLWLCMGATALAQPAGAQTAVRAAAAAAQSAQEQRVFDEADLFTPAQEQALEEDVAALRAQMQMDVVIVTAADAQGKSARAYADDYYDDNGFGVGEDHDGVLLLIDMDNREAYISTCGAMIDLLTDGRIDAILDGVVLRLQEQDYAGAAQAFLARTQSYFEAGAVSGQYQYDTQTGQRSDQSAFPMLLRIAICAAIAAAAGGITVWAVKSRYSMKTEAYTLTSRQIPRETSGAGSGGSSSRRSSTHRSASGRKHGGGGRKF